MPGPSWPLLVQCLVCCLCALCPVACPPVHRHLAAAGPLHSEHPLPKAIQMQQLGDRTKWLWKIAPKASYLRCVLFCFVLFCFICRCPRTQASATAQLHGEMAWPCARVASPGGWAVEAATCDGLIIPHCAVNRTLHPPAATQPVPRQPAVLSWPVMIWVSLLR